jgi:uncharacterized Fe-S cluster-containing radical SAM superfamily protein
MLNLIRKTLHYLREEGLIFTLIHIRRYLTRPLYAKFGRLQPAERFYFETHMVDHCNLDCWGCNHFSSLSDKWFADPDTFTQDVKRLSELFDRDADRVLLLGGEPLLHPDLEKFFPAVREAFPSATVMVVTNGILLSQKEPSFWRECSAKNIDIAVTVYPDMEKQFEEARRRGGSFGVKVYPFGDKSGTAKTSLHYPLDLSGSQSPSSNFLKCSNARCTTLRKGRLYPCCIRPHLHIFNKYFPEHALPESEEDSIDIYAAKSGAEILDFLSRPIPFCRFCSIDKRGDTALWRKSKKDIKEWSVAGGETAGPREAH